MTEERSRFDIPVELRFRDLDAYGHVNNASYFTLMETARVKFLHKNYPQVFRGGPLFLVAKASCEFKRPIRLAEEVTVRISASRFGRSSFVISYDILASDGTLHARGETKMVTVDREHHRPTSVPDDFRKILAPEEA